MRIVFMGTPEFAVPSLEALVAAGHDVVAAYSQPPRPAGRGKALAPSPVQRRAEELRIPVLTPASLKSAEAQASFRGHHADLAVVAAYGLILPRAILDAPARGCVNVHGSILPRWRGAAPVQRAIVAGDRETGITIMQMDEGLDTGAMLATATTPVLDKTGAELTAELATLGADLLIEVLADLEQRLPEPQPAEGATYAKKLDKAEAALDFTRPAAELVHQVRAFTPFPGTWFELAPEQGTEPDAEPVRIRVHEAEALDDSPDAAPGTVLDDALRIATADGVFAPTSVQRAGRPKMPVEALLRGFAIPPGTRVLAPESLQTPPADA